MSPSPHPNRYNDRREKQRQWTLLSRRGGLSSPRSTMETDWPLCFGMYKITLEKIQPLKPALLIKFLEGTNRCAVGTERRYNSFVRAMRLLMTLVRRFWLVVSHTRFTIFKRFVDYVNILARKGKQGTIKKLHDCSVNVVFEETLYLKW